MAVISGEGGAMYLTIQERLKDLRVERGLTLKELSEQTGLSSSALGSYESDDITSKKQSRKKM